MCRKKLLLGQESQDQLAAQPALCLCVLCGELLLALPLLTWFFKKPQSSLIRKRPDAAVLETVWVLTQVPKAISGLGPVLTLDTAGLLGWLTVAWTRDEAGKHQPLHLFPLPLPPP